MHKTTTTTLALVAIVALVGIGVPVQAQVDPDCDAEFEIPTSAQQRELKVSEEETGITNVSVGDPKILTVELLTDDQDAELSFGVFEEVLGQCVTTVHSPDCNDGQVLDDTDSERKCSLPAPTSGVRSYWVHDVNTGMVDVDYKIFVTDA